MITATLGQVIADYSVPMTGGDTFRLSDFRDKRSVVLYFYPKDNTPGCTTEGLDFSATYADFQALGVEIFGVSRDSLKTHENFKAKQQFPFELIADTDEALCQYFEVIKLKNNYGRSYMGIERSTFLIDRAGVLRQEWRNARVKQHVEAVLAAAKTL